MPHIRGEYEKNFSRLYNEKNLGSAYEMEFKIYEDFRDALNPTVLSTAKRFLNMIEFSTLLDLTSKKILHSRVNLINGSANISSESMTYPRSYATNTHKCLTGINNSRINPCLLLAHQ